MIIQPNKMTVFFSQPSLVGFILLILLLNNKTANSQLKPYLAPVTSIQVQQLSLQTVSSDSGTLQTVTFQTAFSNTPQVVVSIKVYKGIYTGASGQSFQIKLSATTQADCTISFKTFLGTQFEELIVMVAAFDPTQNPGIQAGFQYIAVTGPLNFQSFVNTNNVMSSDMAKNKVIPFLVGITHTFQGTSYRNIRVKAEFDQNQRFVLTIAGQYGDGGISNYGVSYITFNLQNYQVADYDFKSSENQNIKFTISKRSEQIPNIYAYTLMYGLAGWSISDRQNLKMVLQKDICQQCLNLTQTNYGILVYYWQIAIKVQEPYPSGCIKPQAQAQAQASKTWQIQIFFIIIGVLIFILLFDCFQIVNLIMQCQNEGKDNAGLKQLDEDIEIDFPI